MIPNADSFLSLAGIRHLELQEEIAQYQRVRAAYGDGPTLGAALSAACRRLGEKLARARQHLELIRWTLALTRRGALPR